MTRRRLTPTAAIALLLTAIFTLAGFATHPRVDPGQMAGVPWQIAHALLWIGAGAGIVAVVGLYLHYRTAASRLGATGSALATLGFVVLMVPTWSRRWCSPAYRPRLPRCWRAFPPDPFGRHTG